MDYSYGEVASTGFDMARVAVAILAVFLCWLFGHVLDLLGKGDK